MPITRRHRPPVIRYARLLADGVTVLAVFDKAVYSATPADGWSFEADASPCTISDAIIEGHTVLFTLSAEVYDTAAVTYSYDSSTGSLRSLASSDVGAFEDVTDGDVENLSEQLQP